MTEHEMIALSHKLQEIGINLKFDSYIAVGVVSLISAAVGGYWGAYLKKKAEQRAVNEDFIEIRNQLKITTEMTEGIKNSLSKDIEQLKGALSRSEHIFKYKLDALVELNKIWYAFVPKRSTPDMDWHEACEEIASNFLVHEKTLLEYISKYGPALSKETKERVMGGLRATGDGQFEFYWHSEMQVAQPHDTAIKIAEELYNALSEALDLLSDEINLLATPERPLTNKGSSEPAAP